MSEVKDKLDTAGATNIASDTASTTDNQNANKKIPCIIVLGMAGAGKTSFVSRLVSRLHDVGKPYVVNLDPACKEVPYSANIGNCHLTQCFIYTFDILCKLII